MHQAHGQCLQGLLERMKENKKSEARVNFVPPYNDGALSMVQTSSTWCEEWTLKQVVQGMLTCSQSTKTVTWGIEAYANLRYVNQYSKHAIRD